MNEATIPFLEDGKYFQEMFLIGMFISPLYLFDILFILNGYLSIYGSSSLSPFLSSSCPFLFSLPLPSPPPLPSKLFPRSLLSSTLEIFQAHFTYLSLAKKQSFFHGALALFIESLLKTMIWVLSRLFVVRALLPISLM